MSYSVEIRPAALKALRKVERSHRLRILGAIEMLADDPRPPAAKRLVGRDGWRVRVGDYRVLYTIDDGVLTVVVVALGHRREVYR